MPNERKTEKLVRKHFEKYEEDGTIKIEEQSSDDPRIRKLLKNASKGEGGGRGFPEFIIRINSEPNLIIVIECKADTKFHNDEVKDLPEKYAVQGVLSYSQYLSKEFDVLSIAVSGEEKKKLKITHHLQLKNSLEGPKEKFSNKLLSIEDYLEGYKTSEEKFRQDYDNLLTFSQELNKRLQNKKIPESRRALLVGGILIALENKFFKDSFKEQSGDDLSKDLYNKIELQYKHGGIKREKLDIIMEELAFIKSHESLKTGNTLRELVRDIDININTFIRTHEYYDILGELYIEFLRYANSDKGLGIVLTPGHITEFMAKIAEVDEKSIIYDNCTGTGGFLVSAMRLMIEKAKGDSEKIKNIKQKQLIGTEFQPNIYTLAVSNMFIHQDGKTNILNGDCFKEDIIEEVKKKDANVGLLNPPYKSDKREDKEELEFVLNNLECLQQNGKCVAILPMQIALATGGKILELKERLLRDHTLEAVLSMPDELFNNSKVAVVSCIMVFTAWKPHQTNKTVFFGYFKDDGYVKRKPKGRIDAYNKWEKIKENWINHYRNKKDADGLSINKKVSAEDEWSAEAYMKTDYSDLSELEFEKVVRDFVAFKIVNESKYE